jgi:hypothetical protein
MEKFVNRDEELMLIDSAVDTLLDRKRLLRTPIIEFYGVEGIGKSTLLKEFEQHCHQKSVMSIWGDGGKSNFYHIINTTKERLQKNQPVVVILDALDDASDSQFQMLETELADLIENSQLFVVLSSQRMLRFDNIRSIARKLTARPLQPLDQESCRIYLDGIDKRITSDVRDMIFSWTRGYPLAMETMVEAILDQGLDLREQESQKVILSILTEKVIHQSLLSKISFTERDKYQSLLSLLSVPRRFNVVIMQDIIEEFEPAHKLESSLAYITLPNTINQATNVLSWDLSRAGYCVDSAARNLFLLKLRIEETQRYVAVHKLLAKINERFAGKVTGSDRVRYLREYLYHLASSGDASDFASTINKHLEALGEEPLPDSFLQFYEEFLLDEELKEALGVRHTNSIISFVRRKFVEKYIRASGIPVSDRIRYLREFFTRTAHDPKIDDFSLIFEEGMRQIIQEEPPAAAIKLFGELLQDEGLKELLGKDFDRIAAITFESLSEEG